jgi:hypothetical protein
MIWDKQLERIFESLPRAKEEDFTEETDIPMIWAISSFDMSSNRARTTAVC